MLNLLISIILFRACLTSDQEAVHIHIHESNESKPIHNRNKNIIGDYSKKQIIGPKGFIILYNNVFLYYIKT